MEKRKDNFVFQGNIFEDPADFGVNFRAARIDQEIVLNTDEKAREEFDSRLLGDNPENGKKRQKPPIPRETLQKFGKKANSFQENMQKFEAEKDAAENKNK